MYGTSSTACVVSAVVTTTLFASSSLTANFNGAQYQQSIVTVTPIATTQTAASYSVWGRVGYASGLVAKTTTIAGSPTATGGALIANQNAYWDFMQTNVVQGSTSSGRGGGSTSYAPCGWYVGYFNEAPGQGFGDGGASAAGGFTTLNNAIEDGAAPTLNFWTDNSVIKAASAFVIAGLAGLLF